MFLIFTLISIFSFTIPGVFLLKKSQALTNFERIFFGTIVGLIFFTLLGYTLLVLQISLLLVPIILIIDIYCFKYFLKLSSSLRLSSKKEVFILSCIFILGILGQFL